MPKELETYWAALKSHLEQTAPALPTWPTLLGLFLLAAALVLIPQVWRWTGYFVTVVHEGGHAVAGMSVGRRLHGIKIRWDRSGETMSAGGGFIPFRIWTTWWGYPAPAVLGSLYLWAASEGWQGVAMTITLVISVIMFLQIRSFMALITITLTMVATWYLWWHSPKEVVALVLYGLGWFLILGGIRVLQDLTRNHLRGDTDDSDARALREMTYIIPGFFWLISFWAATLIAFAFPLKSLLS